MVRTCQHHESYVNESVRCGLHGLVNLAACSGCKEFKLNSTAVKTKVKQKQSPHPQTGFACVYLGSKRKCCQDLFLCKKFPGESCSPSSTVPNVIHCSSCPEFMPVDKTELWRAERRGDKSNPRVGFISAAYMQVGGTETFHRSLLPRLKNTVDVAGFVATDIFGGDSSLLHVPYATGTDAARVLAKHCDTVVVWGIDNLASVLPSERPRVIAVHHSDWSSQWSNDQILKQISLVDEVVCVNETTARKLQGCGRPVRYIPNAIDPERIKPSGRQYQLRSMHGIPGDAKIVLFGHRLSEEKRPLLAAQVSKHLPGDWLMVIAGDGPERLQINAMANDQLRVVGACESLADWLSISDCFLSLSTFEGFGLSIAEALAAGVPVVSTPTGIATGLATTLPVDSTAMEWADEIVNAERIVEPETVADRFCIERMVSEWQSIMKVY